MSATGREIMGTPEQAKADLVRLTKRYRELRQPRIASRRRHKEIEAEERETRNQLCQAALWWLWHEEHPADAQEAAE